MSTYDLDLDGMSEEEQTDWACTVLCQDDDDAIAKALDILGWKIVCQREPGRLWPFSSKDSGCASPSWCEDSDSPDRVGRLH